MFQSQITPGANLLKMVQRNAKRNAPRRILIFLPAALRAAGVAPECRERMVKAVAVLGRNVSQRGARRA